jgi:hypothetical protein
MSSSVASDATTEFLEVRENQVDVSEIEIIFYTEARKMTPDYVQSWRKTIVAIIDKEEISVVKTDSKGKLEESMYGSNIYNGLENCLEKGGELLQCVIFYCLCF